MTENYHTPIQSSPPQPANADTINAPLAELDAAITDHEERIGDLEENLPTPSGNPTEYLDGEGNYTVPAGTGASVDGHVIKDEGIALPQRASIDFVGAGVAVTNEAGGTQVSIPGGATDHGTLTGLGDDDHLQYHNDARGDARYPIKHIGKTTAPTVDDDSGEGYAVGDRWLDETNDKEYVALDVTVGAAVWTETTSTGGGGLTVSIASVTTSNVAGVENVHHILNVAGMTANRDFNLPTPSAAGIICKVSLSAGDDTYALIIKVNGSEVTRLFITNEILEFTSTGTGAADWQLSYDGKKACLGVAERSTAQSINNASQTKVLLNNIVINKGDMVDIVTNNRINIRRNGNYEIKGRWVSPGLEDQESAIVYIMVDGVSVAVDRSWLSTGTTNQLSTPKAFHEMPLTAGQYVELDAFHNEGAAINTDTTYPPTLSVKELL